MGSSDDFWLFKFCTDFTAEFLRLLNAAESSFTVTVPFLKFVNVFSKPE